MSYLCHTKAFTWFYEVSVDEKEAYIDLAFEKIVHEKGIVRIKEILIQ